MSERPPRETISGVRPVIEAIRAARREIDQVVLPAGSRSAGLAELEELLRARRIPAVHRPGEVSAVASPFPEEPFEQLLGAGCAWIVALDRVTDVGNLGSIARSALTAGASGLLLEHRHAPPISAAALRASAGALEHLRVGRSPNLRRALALARGEGYRVLAAEPSAPPFLTLDPAELRGRLVWLFGSEDRGVRPGLRDQVDRAVGIPLQGPVGSLGVAAAAAILLHRTAELRESLAS